MRRVPQTHRQEALCPIRGALGSQGRSCWSERGGRWPGQRGRTWGGGFATGRWAVGGAQRDMPVGRTEPKGFSEREVAGELCPPRKREGRRRLLAGRHGYEVAKGKTPAPEADGSDFEASSRHVQSAKFTTQFKSTFLSRSTGCFLHIHQSH